MEEKFGIVIEAVTTGFKAKMNEIKNLGQQTADKIKQGFQTNKVAIDVDTSKVTKIAELRREISTLKSEMKYIDPGTGAFREYATAIDQAEKELKQLTAQQKEVKKNANTMKGMSLNFKNMGINVNKLGNSFQNAINKVKRFGLALLSVRGIYSLLSKASQAYMAFDTNLSNKLQSAWAGLGAQLAPIIEFIINLFAKAVAYVNAFIKALTGINMVARANAKALNKQAGATKSANKALTSMDEITNIQKDAGGGAGGGDIPQIELPEVDTSKLEGVLNRIKEIASTLFEPIQNAWNTYGAGVIKSMNYALNETWGLMQEIGKSFAEVWTNGTGEETIGWLLQILTDVFNIIGNISKAFKNAWAEDNIGTQIIQNLADTFNSILEFVESIGDSLSKWTASESFQNAIKTILKVVKDLSGYIKDIVQWVVDMYKKYLAPVVDELLGLLSDVINLIGAIWDVAKPVVDKVVNVLKTMLEPVIQMVGGALQTVISIIRLIVQVVTGSLKGNWDSVWNSMRNTARSVVNGLIGFMNGWIRGLNAMLGPLRKVISTIASAFGKNVSMSSIAIPTIPKLATGTNYVPEDQLAYIHKGEAVVPKKFNSAEYFSNINDNQETNALLLEVNKTLIEIREKDTTLNINGKELARTTYNDFRNEGNRLGQSSVVNVR